MKHIITYRDFIAFMKWYSGDSKETIEKAFEDWQKYHAEKEEEKKHRIDD